MKKIGRHLFLILAIVLAGLSAVCYLFLERDAPGATDEQYVNTIQQRIQEELSASEADLRAVADQLRQRPKATFADLRLDTEYPYYVFRKGQLLYWSEHRFIPEYRQVANVKTPTLVEFEQGRYLVSHERVVRPRDTLDVFSLLNVYRHYRSSNAYLQSGYNPALFARDPQAISLERTKSLTRFGAIYDNTPLFLFSVVPPPVEAYRNHSTPVNTVILATLSFLFLGFYVVQYIRRQQRKRRYEWGFVWLAGYLLALRAIMLYFSVPILFVDSDVFNPKFYASSALVPSLGDLLLNALVVAILGFYWVINYYRSHLYAWVLRLPKWIRPVFSVACVMLSYGVFYVCYAEINNIYVKSQFTLDITLSIRFSLLKAVCLLVFIIISFIYFLYVHLLASLFVRINRNDSVGFLWIAVGTAGAAGLAYALNWPLDPIGLLNTVYLLGIYVGGFPRMLYGFRYKTSIYLFWAAFVCALMTAYVVYNQENQKRLVQERAFGRQLLAENDEFGEFLISKAQESISRDPEIGRALRSDTVLVRERIQQRVKSIHLDKYFDKYDIDVSSFKLGGRPLDGRPNAVSFAGLQNRYQRAGLQTGYSGVYFVNEVGNQFIRQYVCFAPSRPAVAGDPTLVGDTLGYVVLDLRLRTELPKSVYPELLLDTKFIQDPDAEQYSYAIFGPPDPKAERRLLYSAGDYNYERKLTTDLLNDARLYANGLRANQYRHVAQRSRDGRVVVVSSAEYPVRSVFSNFSFLYMSLVLAVVLVMVAYAVRYGFSHFSVNYSTRIQILLNVAFFLPLLLVIVMILSVVSANYVANQENTYISSTRNIASNFLTYLDEHVQARKRSKESMEEELSQIARDANIDVNLFDTQGRLYTSTRPMMYENGYLSKRINPEAYVRIIEDKENQVLLNESLGSKAYRTAYAGIKSYDGRLLGILSIPYFSAGPELDRQLIEVIASALSVFTLLFLLFLLLSYVASNILTMPLKLLTQKIRKTNLDKPNDPLAWRSDDEIGILIQEYNRMLVKLEESKKALAQTEKQSAWREMAKQVAHEIKNPLTPMKLTLQHLQRTLPSSMTNLDAKRGRVIERTFDSLLDQIDNLSDIATSFSDFAKMPLPRTEKFEITNVLNRAADLYADDSRIVVRRQIVPGPVMVVGDRQLVGRILTNLIINGIQSVPAGRKPTLDLRLYTDDDTMHIEVRDNGSGIPEAIRTKVFLPNFSTKRGGSGLGLAIAKRGVEHAGGSIWFETVEDVGTTFHMSLPLAVESVPTDGQLVAQ